MSKLRPPRRSACYLAVTEELTRHGIPFVVQPGGRHWRVIATINGVEKAIIVSGSPSDVRAGLNAKTRARRIIRALQSSDAVGYEHLRK